MASVAFSTIEYQAIVPNGGGPGTAPYNLQWLKLEYPSTGARSVSDVVMSRVTKQDDALGAWQYIGFENGTTPMLAAKIREETLYVLLNTGKAPTKIGGCCADTIRAFPRLGGKHTDIDIENLVRTAFPSSKFAHATHTFHVTEIRGVLVAVFLVQYVEPKLKNPKHLEVRVGREWADPADGVLLDAVMAVSLVDGGIIPTADGVDGELYFSIFDKMGTTTIDAESIRRKVPFYRGWPLQQWHANGLFRFTARCGTSVLAISLRDRNEVVLIKDPFTYESHGGHATILQRFGGGANGNQRFGLQNPAIHQLHNVWHHKYPSGRETITLFANGVSSDSRSHLFEFDVNLQESDSVFPTNYSTAAFSFFGRTQGGARPLGNGVWIGASGSAGLGIELVDQAGGSRLLSFTEHFLYDAFAFFTPKQQPVRLIM